MVFKQKKFLTIIGFFILFIGLFCFYSVFSQANQKVIVISPGHSIGWDTGAVSSYCTEAEINEGLAGRVVRLLNQKGYKVYITHTTDSGLASQKLLDQESGSSLRACGNAINRVSPDLTLVLHHNSGGSTASGYELYWSSYRSFDSDGVYTVSGLWSDGADTYRDKTPCLAAKESERFALITNNHLNGQPRLKLRKIVERDDYLPAHVTSPCILYEGGFISNPSEAQYLASDAYQNEAAARLVSAIDEFLGNTSFVNTGSSSTGGTSSGTAGNVTSSSPYYRTPISGNNGVTASQLVNFYNNNSSIPFPSYYTNLGVTLDQFAQMYIDECRDENIRADLAFAQAMLETGFLRFGGDVKINQFNFAGIGATGGGVSGADFAAQYGNNANGIRMGIRAQIQHLKAYGSTNKLNHECIDPRFQYVTRGSAPTLADLAGKWAADTSYAVKIAALMEKIPGNSAGQTTTSPGNQASSSTPSTPSTDNLPPITQSPSATPNATGDTAPSGSARIYRLYNKNTGEHLFTPDYNEYTVLGTKKGWTQEGVGWYAPSSSPTPIYRLYNPKQDNHLYTGDLNEIKTLTAKHGWVKDNNGAPLFYSGGNVPVYRVYNQEMDGLHHLTTDTNEYNVLPNYGWTQENISFYAMKKG